MPPAVQSLAAALCFSVLFGRSGATELELRWRDLPALPDSQGVAGAVAGVSDGELLVIGGSNFPDAPPWAGGVRKFYDTIWCFNPIRQTWRTSAARLPIPLAYAAGGAWQDGVIVVGGATSAGLSSRVFLVRMDKRDINVRELSALPVPLSHASGVMMGDSFFVAGGLTGENGESSRRCWVGLPRSAGLEIEWKEIEPWPGPARHLAVVAATPNAFFIISGMRTAMGSDGRAVLQKPYFRDAFVYEFGAMPWNGRWRRLPDIPHAVAAAPSPAAYLKRDECLLILGGLEGDDAGVSFAEYPPFRLAITVFSIRTEKWHLLTNQMPAGMARVTAPLIEWHDGWVIPGGETAPARRSSRVLHLSAPGGTASRNESPP